MLLTDVNANLPCPNDCSHMGTCDSSTGTCDCIEGCFGDDCTIVCDAGHFDWIGDGSCDDSHNKANCIYDGGDCCGPNVNNKYCTVSFQRRNFN